jgi:hypothetical protein
MRLRIAGLVLLHLVAGCAAPAADEARIYTVSGHCEPWGIGDAYLTVVEVSLLAPDGTRTSTLAPRVVVQAGDRAEIALGNVDGSSDLAIQVTMPDKEALADGALVHVRVPKGAVARPSQLRVPIRARETTRRAWPRFSCSFHDADVMVVVDQLSSGTATHVSVPHGLEGEVTLVAENLTCRTGLALAVHALGYAVEERGESLLLVPDTSQSAECIDVRFEDADVRSALQTVALAAGADVVTAPNVEAQVTLTARGVPWQLAVEAIAEAAGCRVDYEGESARVSPAE